MAILYLETPVQFTVWCHQREQRLKSQIYAASTNGPCHKIIDGQKLLDNRKDKRSLSKITIFTRTRLSPKNGPEMQIYRRAGRYFFPSLFDRCANYEKLAFWTPVNNHVVENEKLCSGVASFVLIRIAERSEMIWRIATSFLVLTLQITVA